MGLRNYPDILEYIISNIDDLFIINNSSFGDHLNKLKIFQRKQKQMISKSIHQNPFLSKIT